MVLLDLDTEDIVEVGMSDATYSGNNITFTLPELPANTSYEVTLTAVNVRGFALSFFTLSK